MDIGKYLSATVAACAVAGFVTTTSAQEVLRLGHDQPTAHGYQEAGKFLNERVEEATGGAYEVRIFPGAQLGNEMAMLDEVLAGNLDMSIAAAANAATFVPELGVFSVSYLFTGLDHFKRVLNDEQFNAMLDDIIDSKGLGLRRIATFTAGARNVYNQGPGRDRRRPRQHEVAGVALRVNARMGLYIGQPPR